MRPISSRLLLCCWLCLGIGWVPPARAATRITATAIDLPGVHLQNVTARIDDDGAGHLRLRLHAAGLDVAALGWRSVGVSLDGVLQRDEGGRWLFDGHARLAGAPGRALDEADVRMQASPPANTLLIDVIQGRGAANVALPLDQPSHAQITLQNLPLGWLQGLLGTVWSGRIADGRVNARLALDVRAAGMVSSGQFTLANAAFGTTTGTLSAKGLDAGGRFNLDTTDEALFDLDATLHGGVLQLGPLGARLPEHPVQLGLHADVRRGALELSRLRLTDADALQLDGALGFDAKGALKKIRMDRLHAAFPAAYHRYGQTWLDTLDLRDMRMSGTLDGSFDLRADGWHAFAFRATDLDAADADGRFGINGLQGGIDWSAQADRPATTLAWRGLQFHRVPVDAAQSHWRSHAGTLSLQQPLQLPIWKGDLRIGDLDWDPAAAKGQRLSTSMVVTGIDLPSFCRAMGWPAFPGTLAGAVPSLRWIDDRLELQGGLSANLFDGFIDITRMSLAQPFGTSPVLSADLGMQQLDLAALTSVFDFGSISGRLDGSVKGLRLLDWSPVAFDATLRAVGGGRISQRAVGNLTAVGGGAKAGGLQGAMLKLFHNFSYKRIGLDCTLEHAVCHMGGLQPDGDGYTIVEGSGIPRLRVIGHQQRVDWATLVRRLREAVDGAAPQIR